MAPVAAVSLAVPTKIVMRGNSTMSLNQRFSGIGPPIQPAEHETKFTARLDVADFRNSGNSRSHRDTSDPIHNSFSNHSAQRQRSNYGVHNYGHRKPVRQRLGAKSRLGYMPQRFPRSAANSSLDELMDDFNFHQFNRNFRNNFYPQNRNFGYRSYRRRGFNGRFKNKGYRSNWYNSGRWRGGYGRQNGSMGGARGGRIRQRQVSVKREDLDNEIDAYMSKTKLETDVDISMAEI